jgi:hypothetical protein
VLYRAKEFLRSGQEEKLTGRGCFFYREQHSSPWVKLHKAMRPFYREVIDQVYLLLLGGKS